MAARKPRNKNLPLNLYHDASTHRYRYRHPCTGRFHSLSNDRSTAIQQAKLLNERLIPVKDHIRKILSPDPEEFEKFLDYFQSNTLAQSGLSKSTMTDYNQKIANIRRELGHKKLRIISIADTAKFLDSINGNTNANRYRSLLIQILKHARAKGLIDTNPAEATLPRKEIVERSRLTIEEFKAIQSAAPTWCANAMELGLQTLQRRGDLITLKWTDIQDGYLLIKQQKVEKHGTGRIKIKLHPTLETLLNKMKDEIDSPYIIHKQPEKRRASKEKEHHTQVAPEELSRAFQNAREATKLYQNIPDKKRPTFHEIRSLGIKLYTQAGYDKKKVKALSGHVTDAMYEHYLDRHEPQWIIAETNGIQH